MTTPQSSREARLTLEAVRDDLVTIAIPEGLPRGLMKNEMVLVCPRSTAAKRQERLKAEVLRIRGHYADAQVFEDTRGLSIGDPVEATGTLLSVQLGPGLLGNVYDGLQNPLQLVADQHGFFLPRGVEIEGIDSQRLWSFTPTAQVGDKVCAGATLGSVPEGRYIHKIMAPFDLQGEAEVTWIQEGSYNVRTPIARLRDVQGHERPVTMTQVWPVRRSIPERMLRQQVCRREYPNKPLVTTLRLIDTFFPIALGGTACIPGPFGAGKTVLQNLISRFSSVDVVIVVACGERAGEVVETIIEFPELTDPKTGGPLMDRTIIICNTSSMPVAARESSLYTGLTLGEYYRQMGYDVLLIADSTSRWAQAMRETSGRMEEIPGEEAFPAYLDSAIRAIYERSGVITNPDGATGSLTMIGTVSPAGGNFEEPVTQSTLRVVKTFLGLSYERAYKRFYPAVDPLISWSRYPNQLSDWYDQNLEVGWTARVAEMHQLLRQGDGIAQMMQVTGEEGIILDDFVIWQKAVLLDMVYLQQDAFDAVDTSTLLPRQRQIFSLIYHIARHRFEFGSKSEARSFFTLLTGKFKNLNYAAENTPVFTTLIGEIRQMVGLEAVPQGASTATP
jgi:V/A-type H+/Na+-transporting ATPase subunit A